MPLSNFAVAPASLPALLVAGLFPPSVAGALTLHAVTLGSHPVALESSKPVGALPSAQPATDPAISKPNPTCRRSSMGERGARSEPTSGWRPIPRELRIVRSGVTNTDPLRRATRRRVDPPTRPALPCSLRFRHIGRRMPTCAPRGRRRFRRVGCWRAPRACCSRRSAGRGRFRQPSPFRRAARD